ncbi:uncharacterized protein At2g27730, mitochondrial [Ananas comosus]|uniref:Uncharacterized protein At2g27730, mitochondrial n=2 Tax=Ananas comosus TaxID=4615 RepID=A0A199VMP7_ANACO|nr:uncharacterized protein At2g27730, mitochondrial [Ananas comosus]OAY78467.1 Uncharacterized protein, mitochondrial [Ananas comosus]CAD1838513.1 unnamed protein product [Ananas comosus var. bracteatus]
MATRMAARFVATRRLSSSGGGKVLGEEEKAAENVYIKKVEQEKLEKLARKGPKSGEATSATPKGPEVEANPSGTPGSSTSGVSTDTNRNYAVLAGTIAAVSGLGWYLLSKPKKSDEVVD